MNGRAYLLDGCLIAAGTWVWPCPTGPEAWRVLDKGHQLGNVGEYEGDPNIDERIVTDLLAACRTVAKRVKALPPVA